LITLLKSLGNFGCVEGGAQNGSVLRKEL